MVRSQRDRAQIVASLQRGLETRPEIVLAVLHGSFERGTAFRDIDVAVWLDPERVAPGERFRYALDLSVQLHLEVGSPVDVRVLNDAPLAFRYQTLRGRPLVVRDPVSLDDLRERTWDDYLDFQPFARRYLREALSE